MKSASAALCALTFLLLAGTHLHAQVITSERIERGLTYPGPSAEGYVPYAERYNYKIGAQFYVNGDARQLYYLDYLDRVDRAYKFGYRMPVDPFFDTPPAPQPETVVVEPRGWLGFGILRRR